MRLPHRTVLFGAAGAVVLAGGIGLVACASGGSSGSAAPKLAVVDPYIPQPASPDVAAGYLVVRNDGDAADRLVAVTAPFAPSAEIHESRGNSMQQVQGLDIPAHGQGVLGRGNLHLMFMDPTRQLKKGESVDVTLTFAKSAPITVHVPVLGAADRPGDPGVPSGPAVTAGSPEHTGHGG
ncbi:MAG: copper chaperone PCu(A)C [Streptomycetaceae bacterium]|nr:copper chaperone PCu(A)C [Streptomycetaceae bacterium]